MSGIPDDELADLDDDELEALVETEYRESNERAIRASRAWGAAVFASSRDTIRKDLKRRRRQTQDDKLRRLRLAEAKAQQVDAEGERRRAGRHGKEYPGKRVETAVRLATSEQRRGRKLARTLRDEIAEKVSITPYAVGAIFRLMESGKLADAGRRGWLKIDGQLTTTPSFINLHELEIRS